MIGEPSIDVWLIHDNEISAFIPTNLPGIAPDFLLLVLLEQTALGTLGVADLRRVSLYLDAGEINGKVGSLGVADL